MQQYNIQPTKMIIDGQESFINFKCVDCQNVISQSDITIHQENNHDVIIVNPISSFHITQSIKCEDELK